MVWQEGRGDAEQGCCGPGNRPDDRKRESTYSHYVLSPTQTTKVVRVSRSLSKDSGEIDVTGNLAL